MIAMRKWYDHLTAVRVRLNVPSESLTAVALDLYIEIVLNHRFKELL